ncbi:effector-associated constant component EACC1 [Streptomyces sp. enrichment culture]|uniref:effector-associated constant component EACC1 n=1 Tax=Streptomyces sp. enrichment culture TaxID=1795815 RepID=UPI003F544789
MSRTAQLELLRLPDIDDEELMRLGGQLRRSLDALDVAEIRSARSAGAPPPGTKSGELITTGTIVVTASSFVLRQVLLLADTWLKNRPVRGIRVELDGRSIELGHATATERDRLIDAFLADGEPAAGDESGARPSQGQSAP